MAHQAKRLRPSPGYDPPARPAGYEPMSTFDPTRENVVVWDDLNKEEFRWRPKWAQHYRDAVDERDLEVNNFDGLLLTGA